uniref:rRNA N-glycosylase n=1 Tax=Stellaria media TaxID=13274 RepID=E6YBC2_STEME|nr:stellarin 2 [Stellaria media]
MKFLLAITITWMILQSSTWVANAIALDLANPTAAKYTAFLTSIRDNVKGAGLAYGGTNIPVIGPPTDTFLRIDFTLATGTVSLCLKRNDLYVVGYVAKNDKGKFHAYYFNGQINSLDLDTIFPEAKGKTNQQIIKEYTENYASIETAAKISRKAAGLGIGKLVTYLGAVNGKARKVQDEAKFMLVAIQMVAEAARFGYIQNLVLQNFPNGFTPDDKVLILERNWNRISTAIKGSTRGAFSTTLVLSSPEVSVGR